MSISKTDGVCAGTSKNTMNQGCYSTIDLTDDEDFADASAFRSTKFIPVRNESIKRTNNPRIDNKNYQQSENSDNVLCISDDDDYMETTDDSFSPPSLSKGLNQPTNQSSIIKQIMPSKLFNFSSGLAVENSNVSKINLDNLIDKKSLNDVDNITNDKSSDSVTTSGSGDGNRPKMPPKRRFRWGYDKPETQITDRQLIDKPSNRQFDNKRIRRFFGNQYSSSDSESIKMEEDDDDDCLSKLPIEEIPRPIVSMSHKLMIAGVNVEFPLKPYPSQIAVMNALIRGCTKEEHALIESPTGSGKTLALLCGALAWQKQYVEKSAAQYEEYFKQQSSIIELGLSEKNGGELMEEDKQLKVEVPKKVPKIYYGSRTHRQISQVVKELGRTNYANARMTILSSRDFSCIQNTPRNKTELCNELLDPIKKVGCPYYNEENRRTISTFSQLSNLSFPTPWDIEDFYELGQEMASCPYYAARNLMVEADIIFCPYNYLIDPAIRQSMQIDLSGEIVILDEAHNIEDICRSSASMSFKMEELNEIITDCDKFNKGFVNCPPPQFPDVVSSFCGKLNKFIEITNLTSKDKKSDQLTSKYWTGPEFVEMLRINQLDVTSDNKYKRAAKDAIAQHQQAKEEMRDPTTGSTFIPTLSPATIRLLENIIFSIEMITSADHATDYRIYIKEISRRFMQYSNKSQRSSQLNDRVRVLELLCMNPGVIFAPLAKSARTIALASGTLAPTSSFSSELMTKFPNMLHANHVVPKEQVLVRVVSQGPTKTQLRATYANVNSWKFQDELGRVLLDVCETVPFGILCFFSSYTSMKNLTDRWKQNGVMNKIEQCKYVMEEPRINADLADVMKDYRQKIEDCGKENTESNITGVVLFAVFRGKVAEGIDFSDNEARCVLTIGIPYAVMNDPAIELKTAYNDFYTRERQTLKGREWYTVQAYRALNQALGRCIRHKNDWGAILLVDDRFLEKYNQSYLPNWIKSMWHNGSNHYNLRYELERFVTTRQKADAERISGTI